MNNKIVSIIVILIIIVGGFFLFRTESSAPTELQDVTNGVSVPGEDVREMESVREFTIEEAPFFFSPAVMEAKVGETVRITLKNTLGVHDLVIDEFEVSTGTLQAGEEKTVEFVVGEVGEFEYYCSIGNHRAQGMVGTLKVTE